MKITVVGKVKKVIYRKAEWGIGVLLDSAGTEHKVVGVGVGTLEEGDNIKVSGQDEDNDRWGRQIAVERIEAGEEDTNIGVETWMSSIRDHDPQNVTRISNTWAHDPGKAFDQMMMVLPQLTTAGSLLRWCGKERFLALAKFARPFGPKGLGAVLDILCGYKGIGCTFDQASEKFEAAWKDNPYYCLFPGRNFHCGHRFAQVDKYLMRAKVLPEDSLVRLALLMNEVLLYQGDTVRSVHDVDAELRKNWNFDGFLECVSNGHLPHNVTVHGANEDLIQHAIMEKCEKTIEAGLVELQKRPYFDIAKTDEEVNATVEFKLNKDQVEAVRRSANVPVSIITGGAGVGKTTVMKALVGIFGKYGIPVCLAAPTNKAARRLAQQTGQTASSIHKLLECRPLEPEEKAEAAETGLMFKFDRDEENPFRGNVIILDECSMIDTRLMAAVFRALGDGCRLVLVGDHHQLPPIGDGEPFKDLVNSGRIHKTELTKIMRTNPGQLLNNVTRIREKKHDELEFKKHATWEFIEVEGDDDGLVRQVVVATASKIFKDSGHDPYSFQIITPRKKGHPLSVHEINHDFKDINFPHERTRFARGEKGICTGRSEHHDLLNGDIFVVSQVLPRRGNEAQQMIIAPELVLVGTEPTAKVHLSDRSLENGWAITVHKYQGCEADLIIFVITDSMGSFPNRNMIYTALTRAKKKVIVIGSKTALMRSLGAEEITRGTGFSYGLRQIATHPKHTEAAAPVPHYDATEAL
jgi:hypothetical protein